MREKPKLITSIRTLPSRLQCITEKGLKRPIILRPVLSIPIPDPFPSYSPSYRFPIQQQKNHCKTPRYVQLRDEERKKKRKKSKRSDATQSKIT
jgi:hypothetical protein